MAAAITKMFRTDLQPSHNSSVRSADRMNSPRRAGFPAACASRRRHERKSVPSRSANRTETPSVHRAGGNLGPDSGCRHQKHLREATEDAADPGGARASPTRSAARCAQPSRKRSHQQKLCSPANVSNAFRTSLATTTPSALFGTGPFF